MAERNPKTGKFVKPKTTKVVKETTTKPKAKAKVTATKPKVEPKVEAKVEPKAEPKVEPKVEPKEVVPEPKLDYGKCSVCGQALDKLLLDSRAAIPKYFIACINKDCPKYRYVISWQ